MIKNYSSSLSTINLNQRCFVCNHDVVSYAYTLGKRRFYQCNNCHALMPEKSTEFSKLNSIDLPDRDNEALSRLIFDALKNRGLTGAILIIIDTQESALVRALKKLLPEATCHIDIDAWESIGSKRFNSVVLLKPISMIPNMNNILDKIKISLLPEGIFIFMQPMLDSLQAKLMKNHWIELFRPHDCYFTRDTMHLLLLNSGFDRVWFRRARCLYTLSYLHARVKNWYFGMYYWFIKVLNALTPSFLHKIKFRLPTGNFIVSCQLAKCNKEPTLSIVLPVYNEKNTFENLMQEVLVKEVKGLHKQIIIVESNSTDGTRDLVAKYVDRPEVKIIWQDKPRGKGFAVREGLTAATGDYVLIQDADLEYDVSDYDNLLAPLLNNQVNFVLGSRHSGSWKIREFNDSAKTALIFNIGHVFFTWLINFLTNQHLADPFTMFKVFRRDVLFGLHFTCNRFDFDHEMIIKFIRRGCQPLELPVNYRARSFSEGKKVSFFKDGLFWIFTDLKLRFGKLGQWLD